MQGFFGLYYVYMYIMIVRKCTCTCKLSYFVFQAVSIMQNAIRRFGTYEKYMEVTGGRKLSRYEIIQAAKTYLKDENMEDEVDINISEDLLSR